MSNSTVIFRKSPQEFNFCHGYVEPKSHGTSVYENIRKNFIPRSERHSFDGRMLNRLHVRWTRRFTGQTEKAVMIWLFSSPECSSQQLNKARRNNVRNVVPPSVLKSNVYWSNKISGSDKGLVIKLNVYHKFKWLMICRHQRNS